MGGAYRVDRPSGLGGVHIVGVTHGGTHLVLIMHRSMSR